MYCLKCGNVIAEDARFCNACGAENLAAKAIDSVNDENSVSQGVVNQNVGNQSTVYQNAANQYTGYQNTGNQNQNTSNQYNASNQNTSYQYNASNQNTSNQNNAPNQNPSGINDSKKSDYQANKIIFMLSYLGILFFLPLVCCPNSKPGRFHANQGLVLLITSIVGQIALGIINIILPWSLWALSSLLSVAWSGGMIALVVLGMVYTYKEEERPLPVIGGISIIK
jgi:uncharacterized membrane protein